MELDDLTGAIVDTSIQIHRRIGPGLLESVYEVLLASTLGKQGLTVERQLPVTFTIEGLEFDKGFRVDLLVERSVIVEVKSVERLVTAHRKQLLTYLRLMDLRVGLLLNFGAGTMKEGIKRVVNDLDPGMSPRLRANRHV
jgi:iron complex transport system substrate-binding protein